MSNMEVDLIRTKLKGKSIRYSFEIRQKFHEMNVEEGFSG